MSVQHLSSLVFLLLFLLDFIRILCFRSVVLCAFTSLFVSNIHLSFYNIFLLKFCASEWKQIPVFILPLNFNKIIFNLVRSYQ